MTDLVCMLGLPGSGKTSFLAALYELVSHSDVEGAPRLLALPADRQYLQSVHERWLRCEPALRTKDSGVPVAVHFELAVGDADPRAIGVPDVAGGAIRTLWEERRWTNGLDDLAQSASDVILFIRADDIVQPTRVQLVLDPKAADDPRADEKDEPGAPLIPYNPEKSPTQVKLVDLLQAVIAINPARPLSVAIVLSAWDRVDGQGVGPPEFIRMRLPLLWQFLIVNPERITFRAFGISAQGGDFSEANDAQRLLGIDPPSLRAIVVDDDEKSHNVSRPLQWLWTNR
jgi:Double-GTPase 1